MRAGSGIKADIHAGLVAGAAACGLAGALLLLLRVVHEVALLAQQQPMWW
jgi:hypothetical protein